MYPMFRAFTWPQSPSQNKVLRLIYGKIFFLIFEKLFEFLHFFQFTLADVELIESNGNEVVAASYLGAYDDRCQRRPTDPNGDKEKFKRFLEEKYEKRTWFIVSNFFKFLKC